MHLSVFRSDKNESLHVHVEVSDYKHHVLEYVGFSVVKKELRVSCIKESSN